MKETCFSIVWNVFDFVHTIMMYARPTIIYGNDHSNMKSSRALCGTMQTTFWQCTIVETAPIYLNHVIFILMNLFNLYLTYWTREQKSISVNGVLSFAYYIYDCIHHSVKRNYVPYDQGWQHSCVDLSCVIKILGHKRNVSREILIETAERNSYIKEYV